MEPDNYSIHFTIGYLLKIVKKDLLAWWLLVTKTKYLGLSNFDKTIERFRLDDERQGWIGENI